MTRLRYVCKKLSVTGSQLAQRSGLSRSMIYKYLSGNRVLSLKTARKLAAVLDTTPEDLIGYM